METTLSNDISEVPIKNFVKIKALLYLKRCYDEALSGEASGAFAWCSVPDIALCTGSQPDSLRSILKRWELNGWYVDARRFEHYQMSDNREHTLYKINNKGLSYLNRLPKWYGYIKQAEQVLDDIAESGVFGGSIRIKSIGWPAYPGSEHEAVAISFPFQSAADTHWVLGGHGVILVDNINQAADAALHIFNEIPSRKCIDSAIAEQEYLANKAGFIIEVNRG